MKIVKVVGWIAVPLVLIGLIYNHSQPRSNAALAANPSSNVVATASNTASAPNTVNSSANTTTVQKQSPPTFVPVSKTGDIGNIQVTVNSLQISKTVGSDGLSSTANGYYWIINVTVKNNDSVPRLVASTLFQIHQDTGASYDSDTTADMYANTSNNFLINNLNPGVSMTGYVVFDMPTAPTFNNVKEHFLLVGGGLPLTLQQTSFELP